ncbi:hypothetical protein KBD87_00595 [Candidatus Saccharibacteria bacterium]|nr:hypothetical protein [Candidatus Saccharibacteria bacterium]
MVRDEVLADLAAIPSFGLEVTDAALAEACAYGNLDPQHLGGNAHVAAIEEAVTCELPPEGVRLVTVRADADSVGSMAVLAMRAEGTELDEEVMLRITVIAESDKHHSEWAPAAGFVPATVFDAVKAEVMNFRRPLEERVGLTRSWLETGDFPGSAEAVSAVDHERRETIGLVEEVIASSTGRVAIVLSPSRFAVSAAYAKADVVVAVNESFSFNGGPRHRKVTVCQAKPGLVDLNAVFVALSETEPGWGGSPTIGGSPQGVSSVIPTNEIVRIVEEHLL